MADLRKLKILHIFPSSNRGGSELSAFETIRSLANTNVLQYALFPADLPFINTVKPYVEEVIIMEHNWWLSAKEWPLTLKLKMIRGFLKSALKIRNLIKRLQVNLILTHSLVIPSGAIAAAFSGLKHIWYIHEYGDLDHKLVFNYGKVFCMGLINKLSSSIIVNSVALETYFQPYFPPNKIHQIYYAVDVQCLPPALNKATEKLNICIVGRITEGKNQLVALQALALLKDEKIHPFLTLVGGCEEGYMNKLLKFVDGKDLNNQVCFTGQTEMPMPYLEKADCFLVCSENEAFGRVTVEGMKAGRIPVIANTGAGPELIIDSVNGFLFSPDNAKELADILKQFWLKESIADITVKAQQTAMNLCNMKKHSQSLIEVINLYN